MKYFIIIISLLLDGILSNFLLFMPENLTLFTPSLTLMSIILIYPFYEKNIKKYFITIFILGIIYDLFYTNLFFANAIFFLILGIIISKLDSRIELNKINIILYTFIIIISYEVLMVLSISIFNLVPITLSRIVYKIVHSLLLNIMYTTIVYFFLSKYQKGRMDLT